MTTFQCLIYQYNAYRYMLCSYYMHVYHVYDRIRFRNILNHIFSFKLNFSYWLNTTVCSVCRRIIPPPCHISCMYKGLEIYRQLAQKSKNQYHAYDFWVNEMEKDLHVKRGISIRIQVGLINNGNLCIVYGVPYWVSA